MSLLGLWHLLNEKLVDLRLSETAEGRQEALLLGRKFVLEGNGAIILKHKPLPPTDTFAGFEMLEGLEKSLIDLALFVEKENWPSFIAAIVMNDDLRALFKEWYGSVDVDRVYPGFVRRLRRRFSGPEIWEMMETFSERVAPYSCLSWHRLLTGFELLEIYEFQVEPDRRGLSKCPNQNFVYHILIERMYTEILRGDRRLEIRLKSVLFQTQEDYDMMYSWSDGGICQHFAVALYRGRECFDHRPAPAYYHTQVEVSDWFYLPRERIVSVLEKTADYLEKGRVDHPLYMCNTIPEGPAAHLFSSMTYSKGKDRDSQIKFLERFRELGVGTASLMKYLGTQPRLRWLLRKWELDTLTKAFADLSSTENEGAPLALEVIHVLKQYTECYT